MARGKMASLMVSKIRTDGGTQARVEIDPGTVEDYTEATLAGAEFPPIVAFWDGKHYWLADGFHRLAAHVAAGIKHIIAEVHRGNQRDAVLYAVGANSLHGLRRTRADVRRAVEILLNDEEWSVWSNYEIAHRCGVSEGFVRKLRRELKDEADNNLPGEEAYNTRIGPVANDELPEALIEAYNRLAPEAKLALHEKAEEDAEREALKLHRGSSRDGRRERIDQGVRRLEQARKLFEGLGGSEPDIVVAAIGSALAAAHRLED